MIGKRQRNWLADVHKFRSLGQEFDIKPDLPIRERKQILDAWVMQNFLQLMENRLRQNKLVATAQNPDQDLTGLPRCAFMTPDQNVGVESDSHLMEVYPGRTWRIASSSASLAWSLETGGCCESISEKYCSNLRAASRAASGLAPSFRSRMGRMLNVSSSVMERPIRFSTIPLASLGKSRTLCNNGTPLFLLNHKLFRQWNERLSRSLR